MRIVIALAPFSLAASAQTQTGAHQEKAIPLAQHPYTGWSSWSFIRGKPNEEEIKAQVDALVANRLPNSGTAPSISIGVGPMASRGARPWSPSDFCHVFKTGFFAQCKEIRRQPGVMARCPKGHGLPGLQKRHGLAQPPSSRDAHFPFSEPLFPPLRILVPRRTAPAVARGHRGKGSAWTWHALFARDN